MAIDLLAGMSGELQLVLFIVLGLMVIGVALFIPVLKLILDIAQYSYPNARVSAMDGKLFKRKKYSALMESASLEELASMLEGTTYEHEVGEIGGNVSVKTLEGAVGKEHLQARERLLKILPPDARKLYSVYFKRIEADVLKALLRSKFSGVDLPVQPYGQYDETSVNRLKEATDVKELVSRLEKSEYYPALNTALNEYEQTKSLLPLEVALDSYVLNRAWGRISSSSNDFKLLKNFLSMEIDLANINFAVRAKADGLSGEAVEKFMINGGTLSQKLKKEMADVGKVSDLQSVLESTAYGKVFSEVLSLFEASNSLGEFGRAFRKYRLGIANGLVVRSTGLGPSLGYMLKKENEVQNLNTVIRCMAEKVPQKRIEELIVLWS